MTPEINLESVLGLLSAADVQCSVCCYHHGGRCPLALDTHPGRLVQERDRLISALSYALLVAWRERDKARSDLACIGAAVHVTGSPDGLGGVVEALGLGAPSREEGSQ